MVSSSRRVSTHHVALVSAAVTAVVGAAAWYHYRQRQSRRSYGKSTTKKTLQQQADTNKQETNNNKETSKSSGKNTPKDDIATATAASSSIPAPLLQRFEACAKTIQQASSRSLTNEQKQRLYGLYKQATVGPCTQPTPPPKYQLVEFAKYHAWKSLGEMDQMTAMQQYIDLVVLLEFTKAVQDDGDDQADIIYSDSADEDGTSSSNVMDSSGMGMRPSTLVDDHDDYDGTNTSAQVDLHIAARDNRPEELQQLLKSSSNHINPDTLDESGQTALHLAADRGHTECVAALLKAGANPKAADRDGISVLQAAVIAGQFETCKLLLQHGADPDQADMDGDTPRSCAIDDPTLYMLLFRASQALLAIDPSDQEQLRNLENQDTEAKQNVDTTPDLSVFDKIPIQLDGDGDM